MTAEDAEHVRLTRLQSPHRQLLQGTPVEEGEENFMDSPANDFLPNDAANNIGGTSSVSSGATAPLISTDTPSSAATTRLLEKGPIVSNTNMPLSSPVSDDKVWEKKEEEKEEEDGNNIDMDNNKNSDDGSLSWLFQPPSPPPPPPRAAAESTAAVLDVDITNPNTLPIIATTTGLLSGITTYELIDEYSYRFNSWHNGVIVNKLDREEKFDGMVDDLMNRIILLGGGSGGGGDVVDSIVEALPANAEADAATTTTAAAAAVMAEKEAAMSTTITVPPPLPSSSSPPFLNEVTTTPLDNGGSVAVDSVVDSSIGSSTTSSMDHPLDATTTMTAPPPLVAPSTPFDADGTAVTTETTTTSVVSPPPSSNGEVNSGNVNNLSTEQMDHHAKITSTEAVVESKQYSNDDTAAFGSAEMTTNVSPSSLSSLNEDTAVKGVTMNAPEEPTTPYSDVSEGMWLNGPPSSSYDSGNFDISPSPNVAESTAHFFNHVTGSETTAFVDPAGVINTPIPSFASFQTHTNAVDQSMFGVGGISSHSFESGHLSGVSCATQSFSRWHSEQGGSSNPLRNLAASLPPPIERLRGTGGEYYSEEDMASQWMVATRTDEFNVAMDTTPSMSGLDGLIDGLSFTDVSNHPIISIGDVGSSSATAIPSDASNSFTTNFPDVSSYDDIFKGTDELKSSDFAHTFSSNLPKISMDFIKDKVDAVAHSQQLNSLSEFASSSGASMTDALISAKESGAARLGSLFGPVSRAMGQVQGKIVSAGPSSMRGLEHAAQSLDPPHTPFAPFSKFTNVQVGTTEGSSSSLQNAGEAALHSFHVPAPVSSAIQHASDASLADIGNGIINAVKFMTEILLTVVDANLDLLAPGSNSASVLEIVQSSVISMLDDASYTVASLMNDVGNLSLKDIVHNLMVLIVATADILLKIMNSVVYLISGKDTSGWALQATSAVNEASTQLLAQANEVTHRSIGDLASSIGDYSHHVGYELVALIASRNGVEGPMDGALDVVTTAVQTSLSL
jgi:hypothetical protein